MVISTRPGPAPGLVEAEACFCSYSQRSRSEHITTRDRPILKEGSVFFFFFFFFFFFYSSTSGNVMVIGSTGAD